MGGGLRERLRSREKRRRIRLSRDLGTEEEGDGSERAAVSVQIRIYTGTGTRGALWRHLLGAGRRLATLGDTIDAPLGPSNFISRVRPRGMSRRGIGPGASRRKTCIFGQQRRSWLTAVAGVGRLQGPSLPKRRLGRGPRSTHREIGLCDMWEHRGR